MCSEFSGEQPSFNALHEVRQERSRASADKDWVEAYRRGWAGNLWTRAPPESPPLSDAFKAHLRYLDNLIDGIKQLNTARSEQRIQRACRTRWKARHAR